MSMKWAVIAFRVIGVFCEIQLKRSKKQGKNAYLAVGYACERGFLIGLICPNLFFIVHLLEFES